MYFLIAPVDVELSCQSDAIVNENQDVKWLVSESARPFLVDAQLGIVEQENVLRIAKRLRREMTAQRAALVLEMAQLRIRGRRKFERADAMFFTRRSLEQSSGEAIADYKAQRFSKCASVADICCGIGGDLLSLAKRVKTAGVERDSVVALMAQANLEVSGLSGVVHQQDFEVFDRESVSAFHFDPSRRNYGRKTVGDLLQPALPAILNWVPDGSPVGIKVAPATPSHSSTPEHAELEWIGDARECKQQMIWLNSPQQVGGGRTATVVRGDSFYQYRSVMAVEDTSQVIAEEIQDFVFEPHPTVLASGLIDAMAMENGLLRLAHNVAYLTGARDNPLPLLSRFRVIDVLPMEVRTTARELERLGAGPVEFKKRCVSDVYYEAFKRIKTKGSEPLVVLLAPTARRNVAIIAKRLVDI